MKSYKEFKEGFVHSNHKKLDANNNGKLDANDFKLLRKKKQSTKEDCSMKEDLEEMDLSFIKGAKPRGSVADQKAARDALIAKRKETNPNPPALGTSSDKYKLGDYDKKSNRSYSEEVEPLEELSKKTLGSYVNKASGKLASHGTNLMGSVGNFNIKNAEYHGSKIDKRQKGISKAVDKLTKESVEELDEVSIATLDSYRKKSFDEPGFKRQAGRALAFNKLSSHGDSKVKSSEEIVVAKSQIKDLIKPEHHSKYPISKITSMSHGRKIYRDASAAGHLKEEVELDEMNIGKKQPRPDTHHIVDKENKPLSLAAYYDKAKAEKDRDEKHPGAKVITRGPRGKVREEVEELEELSKKTLGSYIKKSIVDAANKTRIAGDPSVKNVPGSGVDKRIDAGEKAVKRERNTEKAINKLTRESIELEEVELDEKELTDIDVKQKEKVVKGMKKNLQSFKDKYGERAKGVMYATATKIAQKMPD